MARIISLLTDFGTSDGYVAAMKGVILSEAPEACVVDAGHTIPPGDVRAAAWALYQYVRCYPAGTVHAVVVDPGVGSERKALLVEAEDRLFVGPDNGVFAWVYGTAERLGLHAVHENVHRPGDLSNTFHGRDVFAYVAGRLAAGDPVLQLAHPVTDVVRPDWAVAQVQGSSVKGEVIHVDRFGNLITNITREHLAPWAAGEVQVLLEGQILIGVRPCYAAVPVGELLALVGSMGHLEVAVFGGSAAQRLRCDRGTSVDVVAS